MLSLTVSLLAFAGSLDCDRQMERGGAMIMGAIPLVSTRSIVVTRGSPSGEALHSGAAYMHGDKLYVTLDSDEGQAQIRASGGGEGSHAPPHPHPHPPSHSFPYGTARTCDVSADVLCLFGSSLALFAYPYNQLGLAGEPLTCIGKHTPEEGHPECAISSGDFWGGGAFWGGG